MFKKSKDPYERRKNIGKRAKFIIAILVSIVAGLFIYALYVGSPGSITSAATAINFLSSEKKAEFFPISGNLTSPELELKGKNLGLVLKIEEGNLKINKLQFSNFENNSSLILKNYNGKIKIKKPNILQLEGESKIISTDEITINEDKTMDIETKTIKFKSLEITNLDLNSLVFESSSGEINLPKKGSFEINGEKTEISSFKGDFYIKDKFFLQGKASQLIIESKPKVTVKND